MRWFKEDDSVKGRIVRAETGTAIITGSGNDPGFGLDPDGGVRRVRRR
jgi:hypothetical protein